MVDDHYTKILGGFCSRLEHMFDNHNNKISLYVAVLLVLHCCLSDLTLILIEVFLQHHYFNMIRPWFHEVEEVLQLLVLFSYCLIFGFQSIDFHTLDINGCGLTQNWFSKQNWNHISFFSEYIFYSCFHFLLFFGKNVLYIRFRFPFYIKNHIIYLVLFLGPVCVSCCFVYATLLNSLVSSQTTTRLLSCCLCLACVSSVNLCLSSQISFLLGSLVPPTNAYWTSRLLSMFVLCVQWHLVLVLPHLLVLGHHYP